MSINNITWDIPQNHTLTSNLVEITQGSDIMGQIMAKASSYLQFKIGVAIHNYYFPVIVIVGIIGNISSFLVMVRPHNRHISTCVYMACLSVSDTILIIYQGYSIWILPTFELHPFVSMHCLWNMFTSFGFSMIGSLTIVAMTFDKFFAIRFPHKSASFNTPRRAKIVVTIIVVFSIIFNLPQFYVTVLVNGICIPYARQGTWNQIFMFVSFIFNAVGIFGALIIMNGFIISAVRGRKKLLQNMGDGEKSSESKHQRSTERQITIMLLLVSFLYLILIGPGFIHFVYFLVVPPDRDPLTYANFTLSYNINQKLFFTNNSINFFLYCISGQKFRNDLLSLFRCQRQKGKHRGEFSESSFNTGSTQCADDNNDKRRV